VRDLNGRRSSTWPTTCRATCGTVAVKLLAAFGLSAVAAALAAVVAVTIEARRLRGLAPAEAVE
jgi:hypothetical protein